MAIIGIVDSIVAARENGSKYGYAVSANRDLVAMGTFRLSYSHSYLLARCSKYCRLYLDDNWRGARFRIHHSCVPPPRLRDQAHE